MSQIKSFLKIKQTLREISEAGSNRHQELLSLKSLVWELSSPGAYLDGPNNTKFYLDTDYNLTAPGNFGRDDISKEEKANREMKKALIVIGAMIDLNNKIANESKYRLYVLNPKNSALYKAIDEKVIASMTDEEKIVASEAWKVYQQSSYRNEHQQLLKKIQSQPKLHHSTTSDLLQKFAGDRKHHKAFLKEIRNFNKDDLDEVDIIERQAPLILKVLSVAEQPKPREHEVTDNTMFAKIKNVANIFKHGAANKNEEVQVSPPSPRNKQ
ncbi:MAG: hypothetical protein H0W64_03415 [Gammaproteobacteria bacterium]|nr:hypothetical protein [Gammaproteobacteria bacterium]